jgi:hypothetical protein
MHYQSGVAGTMTGGGPGRSAPRIHGPIPDQLARPAEKVAGELCWASFSLAGCDVGCADKTVAGSSRVARSIGRSMPLLLQDMFVLQLQFRIQ